eukprot:8425188-Pyramimonas_sp.AAC.1
MIRNWGKLYPSLVAASTATRIPDGTGKGERRRDGRREAWESHARASAIISTPRASTRDRQRSATA